VRHGSSVGALVGWLEGMAVRCEQSPGVTSYIAASSSEVVVSPDLHRVSPVLQPQKKVSPSWVVGPSQSAEHVISRQGSARRERESTSEGNNNNITNKDDDGGITDDNDKLKSIVLQCESCQARIPAKLGAVNVG